MERGTFRIPKQQINGFDILSEFQERINKRIDAARTNINWAKFQDPQQEVLNQMRCIVNDMANLITDQSLIDIIEQFKLDIGYQISDHDESRRLAIINQENLKALSERFQYELRKIKLEQNKENIEAFNVLGNKIENLKYHDNKTVEQTNYAGQLNYQNQSLMQEIEQIKHLLQQQSQKVDMNYQITKDLLQRQKKSSLEDNQGIEEEEVKIEVKQEPILNDFKVERISNLFQVLLEQQDENASSQLNFKELLDFLQTYKSCDIDQSSFNATYSKQELNECKFNCNPEGNNDDQNLNVNCQIEDETTRNSRGVTEEVDDNTKGNENDKEEEKEKEKEIQQIQIPVQKNAAQTCILHNTDGNLIVGLNQNWSNIHNPNDYHPKNKLELGASIVSVCKVLNYLICGLSNNELKIFNSDYYDLAATIQLHALPNKFVPQHLKQVGMFLLVFCNDGFIEIISMLDFKLIQTIQHSSKMRIQDAQKIQNPHEFMLAFSKKSKNNFTNGMLAAIKLELKQVTESQFQFEYEEIANSEQLFLKDGKPQPVFCFQEIFPDQFLVCVTEPCFKYYDRRAKRLDPSKDIPNPSQSINYNCLQKILNFSDNNPYLIYKDSRSVGFINCVTLDIVDRLDCTYKQGGNLFSMTQKIESGKKLTITSLIYKTKDQSGPEIRSWINFNMQIE
ncbi:UNKNOWN [Stylonychia lemnae]|uniref:Uncharacterized protein n=1 Tax=Stylonychia lemnae TaxID=5949 RepID=A0A078ABJ0_STYLE|nr:UNKNOWN [Stylonychia lemnae]|eukprot:CDW79665.1 UNKNOWN [Stylonychia lemnae]